jgi:hypothetical protein
MARKKLQPKPKQDRKSWQKRNAARLEKQTAYAKRVESDAHGG